MKFFSLFTCLFFVSSIASAQVTVTQIQPLSYGEMVIDPQGDNIEIRTNGQIRADRSTILDGGESVAIFRFEGARGDSVSYSFSTNNTLTSSNGQSVTLNNFQTNRSNPFSIPGSRTRDMNVGATLVVPPSLNGGSFSGNFVLIIDNQ